MEVTSDCNKIEFKNIVNSDLIIDYSEHYYTIIDVIKERFN